MLINNTTNTNFLQSSKVPLHGEYSPKFSSIFYSGLPNGLFPSNRRLPSLDSDNTPEIARSDEGKPIKAQKSNDPPLFKCKGDKSIHLPLVMDTEFTTLSESKLQQTPRSPISSQIRHINEPKGKLFFHPAVSDRCNQARIGEGMEPCPTLEYEFDAFDWLASVGFNVKSWIGGGEEYKNYPRLVVTIYAHFALAELNQIFRGTLKDSVKQLQRQSKITQQRRLLARGATPYQDYVETGHMVKLSHSDPKYRRYNGQTYKLAIRFIDTGAIHGVAGYADIAKNVGHELSYKDNFSKEEKARMLDMAVERPLDFENYALGDLDVYEILKKYDRLMREVYEQLGITDYYREPQLTIGGTVKNLFEAKLAQRLGVKAVDKSGSKLDWISDFKEISDTFFKPISPQSLSSFTNQTKALLAKVQGGRCRNAKQVISKIEELICDIDISGCYGEGQRNQVYPIGTPLVWSFEANSKHNHYPSLYEWLKWNNVKFTKRDGVKDWGELINGAWMARISTFQNLNYPQDLIESWTTPNGEYKENLLAKFIRKSGNDSENQNSDLVNFDTEYGCLKMLHHEIKNGVLTHDLLQVIFTSPEKQQRDLLKKIRVTSSMVYPKSQLIDVGGTAESFKLLKENQSNWSSKNTIEQKYNNKGNVYLVKTERECYGWVSVNLGDLLIDELLINRKKAKITDGKKSPKDQLFKLCVNTTYGDLVSKFFVTSNPCVGNNITARARALAWCMERGFDSFQSITDGGCFRINKVNHKPSFNPNGKKLIAPLEEDKKITAKWINGEVNLYLDDNQLPNGWVDKKAWEHLKKCFSSLDLFNKEKTRIVVNKDLSVSYEPRQGMFEFEVKDYYESGVFHGSANYRLVNPNGVTLKARGYESSRKHDGWLWADDELYLSERYENTTPIGDLLESIANDPTHVPRQEVSIKSGILKVKDYAKHCGKYDEMELEPGDNILKPLLVSEFSIAQFTFKTWEQWNGWEKAIARAKNKGKQSIEGFFVNKDGTLNYQKMIEWVHKAIEADIINPFKTLDKFDNRYRDGKTTHPQSETLNRVRERLEQPFVRSEENAENDRNWKAAETETELDWGRKTRRRTKTKITVAEPSEVSQPTSITTRLKRHRFGEQSLKTKPETIQPEEGTVVKRLKRHRFGS